MELSLVIPKEATFEMIVSQLQPHTDKFLYVVNSTTLSYYDTLDDVTPGNRVLEPTLDSPSLITGSEYRIRDTDTNEIIVCFDERLRNKLLGKNIPELKLPVVSPILSPFDSTKSRKHRTGKMIELPPTSQLIPEIKIEKF